MSSRLTHETRWWSTFPGNTTQQPLMFFSPRHDVASPVTQNMPGCSDSFLCWHYYLFHQGKPLYKATTPLKIQIWQVPGEQEETETNHIPILGQTEVTDVADRFQNRYMPNDTRYIVPRSLSTKTDSIPQNTYFPGQSYLSSCGNSLCFFYSYVTKLHFTRS